MRKILHKTDLVKPLKLCWKKSIFASLCGKAVAVWSWGEWKRFALWSLFLHNPVLFLNYYFFKCW